MNRLLVALLAALDALIVVAVGVVAVAAPLTLLWVAGFDGTADWTALWTTTVRIWQASHFVPVDITLPQEYLTASGIGADAAAFTISLAPFALALFTIVFAARSGVRAARAGAWPWGVGAGTIVVAVLSAVLAATAGTTVAAVDPVVAIAAPTLCFTLPALAGAVVHAWSNGDGGLVDALTERMPDRVQDVVDAGARGVALCVTALVAIGAAVTAVALIVRGGDVVALTEAAHVDALGVGVFALGSLAYLPTLVIWFAAFAAGPGFALGAGTAVSPAGTSLGVVPGIPILGVVPESSGIWLLLLALLVVGAGALAGFVVRGMLPTGPDGHESAGARLASLGVLTVGSGAGAALLAWAASGAFGPGRLTEMGPDAGAFAFAVGLEVAVGAAVTLFAPHAGAGARPDAVPHAEEEPHTDPAPRAEDAAVADRPEDDPARPAEPVDAPGDDAVDPSAETAVIDDLGPATQSEGDPTTRID